MVEWRTVAEAPEYEVSSEGEIRSKWTMRPLIGGVDKDGYRKLVMCTAGTRLHRRVSSLVCAAFHGPRPAGYTVRHLDGVRNNDSAGNLAWGTQKENIADKVLHGTVQRGEKNGHTKLTDDAVRDIRSSPDGAVALARKHGVNAATIYSVRQGRTWAHVK